MNVSQFMTISRSSTPEQIAEGLQDMILQGALGPGERINESTIAQSLGISRNTVREAVRLLESGGLIRRHRGRGMAVWDPSDEDILDLYSARYHLETLAASTVTPATDLSGIYSALEQFRSALRSHDPHKIVTHDLAIHRAVVGLLGNKFLNNVYAGLTTQLQYFLMVLSIENQEYDDISGIENEHVTIVDALESRDPDRASETIGRIIIENRDLVRQAIVRRRTVVTRSS